MIKLHINDLKSFENFLSVANRFVQQGQLIIGKEYSSLYCKNTKDFSTCRLLLDTNTILLDANESIDVINICLRDIPAFRSSVNIIQVVEQINSAIIIADEFIENEKVYAKSIEYKGKTKFKLISVDFQVIEQFVSKALEITDIKRTWSFNIDPVRLDIVQNRTGTIVNVKDDVSVYFYSETITNDENKQVVIDLNAKNSTYINSIALPIADTCDGDLPEDLPEVAVHESAFRLLNILRVTKQEDLSCFFNADYNVFFIDSVLNDDSSWIKSRLLVQIIKGK